MFLLQEKVMTRLTIDHFMTRHPHSIGHQQTLATAHRMMREHQIRHLPVLEAGKLVGIVSIRDLHLLETLKDVDIDKVLVSDAMWTDVYSVGPKASVRKVAAEMAAHKYGSAVIVQDEHVIGVFTTVDALLALSELLEASGDQ